MNRQELITVVEKILRCEGSEAEQRRHIRLLEDEFPRSDISDMIFWEPMDRTAEQIVDEAILRSTTADCGHARVALTTHVSITRDDLGRFVTEAGGRVLPSVDNDGSFSGPGERAWLYLMTDSAAEIFGVRLQTITDRLGACPRHIVDVRIWRVKGAPLTASFCRKFSAKWESVLVTDSGKVISSRELKALTECFLDHLV